MLMTASISVGLTYVGVPTTVMPAPKVAVLAALKCVYWPMRRTLRFCTPCSAWLGMASVSWLRLGMTGEGELLRGYLAVAW